MPSYKAKFTKAERDAFGAALRRLMTDKGFTGADLARQANRYLSSGKGMDRSAISWYLNGRSIPTPTTLAAIARVLGVDPKFLLPRDHAQRPEEGAGPQPTAEGNRDVRMSLLPGNQMHLMLNVHVDARVGWEILKLLEDRSPQPS